MSKSMAVPLQRVCRTMVRESLHSLSDRELLEQFLAGNEAAFAALLDRHGPMVRAACLRVVRDASLADDAFQATFAALVRTSKSMRRPDALPGWLFAIARRMAGKLRLRQERLRRNERTAAQRRPEATESRPWDDLLDVLDEELQN